MSATVSQVQGVALYVLTKPARVLRIVVSALAFSLYVWFAAVRAMPGVRARKAAFRAARRRR